MIPTKEFLAFARRSLQCHDAATSASCDIIAHLAVDFGRYLGLDKDTLKDLFLAGYLRDIGYLAISGDVLKRARRLTEAEVMLIAQHPVHGEWLCQSVAGLSSVLPYIRSHHEKLNGEGYPDGLRREGFPLNIQYFQIVDIYIALTSKRPYRTNLSRESALVTLKKEVEKGWRSPEVVGSFLAFAQQRTLPVVDS